ncbi:hypothetical protein [Nocardia terpenica]|nr:hypothetical protein [Nocardia terpenica]
MNPHGSPPGSDARGFYRSLAACLLLVLSTAGWIALMIWMTAAV